jgi:hypothetical protein
MPTHRPHRLPAVSVTTNWIWSLTVCGVMIFAGFAAIMVVNEKDRAERETMFRQQCVDAGYAADSAGSFKPSPRLPVARRRFRPSCSPWRQRTDPRMTKRPSAIVTSTYRYKRPTRKRSRCRSWPPHGRGELN